MMGENAAPYAAPNAAALSPSSVLCLFPNVDMFSAMGQQAANEAAKQEEQRPQQEVLRSLRSQGRMESSQVFISEAFHLRSGRRGINLSHSFLPAGYILVDMCIEEYGLRTQAILMYNLLSTVV